jgi:hypothetical protein
MKKRLKKNLTLFSILGAVVFLVGFLFYSLAPLPSEIFKIAGLPFTHKNYLVILQNDAELRPTGGFVTSYVELGFDHGLPTGFEMNDVYFGIDQHDYVAPPYPLEELLGYEFYKGHTFRDANFDPNFPGTVSDLLYFYGLTKPATDFDGVFAVNYSLLQNALEVLGKVRVGDMELTAENVFESLEHYVSNIDRHNLEQIKDRKKILKTLARKVIAKAIFSPSKYRALAELIASELETKNIILWFDRFENPYDSAFPAEPEGDFLAFVSANYGGMKTDRYIERNVRYFLTIDPNNIDGGHKLTADLNIELLHTGSENIPLSGQYSGYQRVFLPKGATLINTFDGQYFEQNEDYFVVGEVVELKPGESRTLNYKYELPSEIFDGESYQLRLQKQSGTHDHYSVYVRTPSGTGISSDDFVAKENTAAFEGILEKDLDLTFEIIPDKFPPRLVYQDFLDPDTIVMHFNENLPSSCATDPLNFSVEDLNMKRPDKSEIVRIKSIEHRGGGIFLNLTQPIDQEDEHFRVNLKNIFDFSGNFIEPNPKQITVVQNFIH